MSISISDMCKNPEKLLEKYEDSGVKVLGYSCSYVPEELIISGGLQPFRLPNIGASTSKLTPTFICQFASAVLENILKFEEIFCGFIVAHTCDPMWRLYDIVKKKIKKPVFFLRVPHNTEGELSIDFFGKELLRLKKFLKENFNAEVSNDALLDAIEICNMNRSLLKEIYTLNSDGKCCVDGFNRLQLTIASMWMPKDEINTQIKALNFKSNVAGSNKARLHVSGTAIYDLNMMKCIEDSGCFVVSDDLCTGSRYFWSNVENYHGNPIYALAKRYIQRTPCPSHSPLQNRLHYIEFMIERFKAQGVLIIANKFCDPMLYDAVHIRDALAKRNTPTILIDYENFEQEAGRIKTRVEAFIETLSG